MKTLQESTIDELIKLLMDLCERLPKNNTEAMHKAIYECKEEILLRIRRLEILITELMLDAGKKL